MFDVVGHAAQAWDHVLHGNSTTGEKVECGVEVLAVVALASEAKFGLLSKCFSTAEKSLPKLAIEKETISAADAALAAKAEHTAFWLKAPIEQVQERVAGGNIYAEQLVRGLSEVEEGASIEFRGNALRKMGHEGITGDKVVDFYRFTGNSFANMIHMMDGVEEAGAATRVGPRTYTGADLSRAIDKFISGGAKYADRGEFKEMFQAARWARRDVVNLDGLNGVEIHVDHPWVPGDPPQNHGKVYSVWDFWHEPKAAKA